MTSPVAIYEALSSAGDDRTRARVIAQAFEQLDERYPHLSDAATQAQVRASELRLQKEIEQVRADLRETELRLQKEIAQLRGDLTKEIEELRGDLTKEIEQLRGDVAKEIEQLRGEIRTEHQRLKVELIKWIVPMLLGQVAVIAALVKVL